MVAIELLEMTKEYGSVTAVRNLDLTVVEGEIYALVGPNGSGKSTVLNVLLGLVRPTSGTARLHGRDTTTEALAVRRRLGVVPEGYGVYERLSGRRHVEFAAASRGVEVDPEEVLERVSLGDVADRRAGTYSNGMAKRLVLALALVGSPDVLLFDEPFHGLDPAATETLRDAIRSQRDRGATVLLTTHLFREVQAVADRVGMLSEGRLVREGSIPDLVDDDGSVEALESVFHEAVYPEVSG